MPIGHVNDSPPSCDEKMQGHNRNTFKGQSKRSKILNGWNPKVTYNSLSLITQIRNKLNKCFPKFGNNSTNVHHQTHRQLSVLPPWPNLFILPAAISLLFLSSILDTNWPGVPSFCLFILFMGFLRQEYWSGLSFPPPGDHILSELSTMTHLWP